MKGRSTGRVEIALYLLRIGSLGQDKDILLREAVLIETDHLLRVQRKIGLACGELSSSVALRALAS